MHGESVGVSLSVPFAAEQRHSPGVTEMILVSVAAYSQDKHTGTTAHSILHSPSRSIEAAVDSARI